jgi:hypothetical protein
MYLQEWFLRTALAEAGVDHSLLAIRVDHMRGINYIGANALPLKYPASFLERTAAIPIARKHRYVFAGNMGPAGGRKPILEKFTGKDAIIIDSNTGRDPQKKYGFDESYYQLLRSGYFALCPNQQDWPGPPEYAWTYRFVEACFACAVPICFRKAPLGERFLSGYEYLWDDEEHTTDGYEAMLGRNYSVCRQRHFLSKSELDIIFSSS